MEKKIFYHGFIITMEEKEKSVESVLIEDGIIKAVGELKVVKELAKDAELIDLGGKTMLPSFIDCHSHIMQFARILCFTQLNTAKSFAEIKEIITKKLKEEPENTGWLIGFGYDHNMLKEGEHPDKFLLDEIETKRPILLVHASGHMGCVNSKGLKLSNIEEGTPDPVGGKIGRVAKSKEPNGYLEESAFMAVAKHMGEIKIDMEELFEKAQRIYLEYGITTAQDGFTREEEMKQLDKLNEKNVIKLDVVAFLDIKENRQVKDQYKNYCKRYNGHLKIGGYKLFLDGSPQGRTAWLTKPYEEQEGQEKDYCGYPIYTDEQVKEFVAQAKQDEMQLLTHCNGDKAIDQLLNATKSPSKMRNVIIHAQTMRRDQLPVVKQLHMIPSYFVAHTFYWGDAHIKNLGMERASQISPIASTIRESIPYTFHQDTPVILPNMMETIWCAVNRRTRDGVLLGEEECISVYDALKAVTVYGAYQYFEEQEKGTISVGKRGDFVVLSDNPFEVPKEDLRKIQVEQTYKDGELVYQRKSSSFFL